MTSATDLAVISATITKVLRRKVIPDASREGMLLENDTASRGDRYINGNFAQAAGAAAVLNVLASPSGLPALVHSDGNCQIETFTDEAGQVVANEVQLQLELGQNTTGNGDVQSEILPVLRRDTLFLRRVVGAGRTRVFRWPVELRME
jgi:hypothetical protein